MNGNHQPDPKGEIVVYIASSADIMTARQEGRKLAERLGLNGSDPTLIATAISEVARNIVEYARKGVLTLRVIQDGKRQGLQVVARDSGPGIPDLGRAMQDGFTTGRGLGLGLPGSRRLMDTFQITSEVNRGTEIVMVKWIR